MGNPALNQVIKYWIPAFAGMTKVSIEEAGILKKDASPSALRKESFGQHDNTKRSVLLVEVFVLRGEGGD